ncbi:CHAD domain-containing protein [Burkholderia glumae]|uniref:CHAD domain-containing protein n=1 Tax=Burkholderia glumae TaxID=337 RepID=UPI0012970956|nr:CHAD domain-containing protein [Burkholderia glumae]MCM2551914.1 CHAD domain-containing protein [Burkholderia glumae]NVE25127.1 CHAD domain-containing protein [Burkholderia glumae]QGA41165.1 CHAD domain-containing protein [Burkholderia glumae]
MTRVLEIVLGLPLPGGGVPASRRRGAARAVRDFGAELVRAWRICPPVRMKRGHERLAIRPLALADAVPDAGGWLAWHEAGASGHQARAVRTMTFAPGVAVRDRLDVPAHDAAERRADDSDVHDKDGLAGRISRALAQGLVDGYEIEPAPAVPTPAAAAVERAEAGAVKGVPPAAEAGDAPSARSGSSVTPPAEAVAASARRPFSFECERRRGRWQREDRAPVELTLDDLSWRTAAGAGRHCELRLAVADPGDAAGRIAALRALFDAARELSGAGPAFLKPASLVDLACAGRLPDHDGGPSYAAPVELGRLSTQREALFVLGANVAAQWLGNDAGVRDSNDPEYVHQMRVALRRLRTLMRLFKDFADAAYRDAFAADMKWLGTQLGVVRDWDVCVSETLPGLAEADTDIAEAPGWAATLDAAAQQRDVARSELRQAVASSRYARLVLGWIEWLCVLSLGSDADATRKQRRSLRRHAAKRVEHLFARLYGAPKLTSIDPAERHRVRIDAKRLRYALEFFASITARSTRDKLLKRVSRLQGTLGDANDAQVALHHLERLSAPAGQLGFARGYGAAAQRYAAIAAEVQLRRLWRPKIRGVGGRQR